eukprot:scaffold2148_cov28-Cyclotella_meneghiniana.AAC.1
MRGSVTMMDLLGQTAPKPDWIQIHPEINKICSDGPLNFDDMCDIVWIQFLNGKKQTAMAVSPPQASWYSSNHWLILTLDANVDVGVFYVRVCVILLPYGLFS